MKEIVFLVEEGSMKEVLNLILPRVIPEGIYTKVIAHSGKSDLEKSIPRKLRGWANPQARFVVMRDNDGGDCRRLKDRLRAMCAEAGRPDSLIRIVCQELEAWFLGDLQAVEDSGIGRASVGALQRRNPFRDPDSIVDAKGELRKLAPSYKPLLGSRTIARHLKMDKNLSGSFNSFISGLRRVIAEIERQ